MMQEIAGKPILSSFRKRLIFGVGITAITRAEAVETIIAAAQSHRSFGVCALAVHGLITAVQDRDVANAVSSLDLVLPDGQPIRWALRLLHGIQLSSRVYGPDVMSDLCARAAAARLPICLFGSTAETCERLARSLKDRYPPIQIAHVQPDRFREATSEEDAADVDQINQSGAAIVFVGRGCPRQEKWVATHIGRIKAPMIAVGAAFDFLSGQKAMAPRWMQDRGLEWLFRLTSEPRRLWKRYLITNSLYVAHLARALATKHFLGR
jgi:N-acetylglucosaminyldiphosphoundecaprenol N-acetyl-beta-D-mannosaminyltransferase